MIDKQAVEKIVLKNIDKEKFYIHTIDVKSRNIITILVDSFSQNDFFDLICSIKLSKAIEESLVRDVEDYELTVSSAGLDTPFTDIRQYKKYKGTLVDIVLKTGIKHNASKLLNVDDKSILIEVEKKMKFEGKKSKVLVKQEIDLKYDEIKTTFKNI